ncbi:hypothetical protein QTP88_010401 [Uroleucon formosanum]
MSSNLNESNIVDYLFEDIPSDDNSLTDIDDFDDQDYLPQQKAIEVVESSSSDENEEVMDQIITETVEFEFVPPNWSKNMTSIWPPLSNFESLEGPSDSVDRFRCHTPFSIFNYLFSDEIMNMLVEQTNLYSFQRSQKTGKPYTQTNIQELKTFFGINLLMGIKRMPSYRDYWSSQPDLHDPYISSLMTVNRFGWLLSTLHINNNVMMPKRGEPGYDKLYKDDVKKICKGYFESVLNEEYPKESLESVSWNEGLIGLVGEEEVKIAVKAIKKKKVVGPDEVPVEEKCRKFGESFIVSIFKGKGDIQECGNYGGIKLMSHSMKILEKIIEKRIRNLEKAYDKRSVEVDINTLSAMRRKFGCHLSSTKPPNNFWCSLLKKKYEKKIVQMV